jgi:hypothetical protein
MDSRKLPLERVVDLDIAGTHVTEEGLKELARCEELIGLLLDGHQFNANVVTILNALPNLTGLELVGSDVTGHHIGLLHLMPRVDRVTIEGTSATQEAIEEYAKARPDSVIMFEGAYFPGGFQREARHGTTSVRSRENQPGGARWKSERRLD